MDNPGQSSASGPRPAWRRPVLTIAGGAVVLAGVVMLVAPGPGLVVIALGLAILGREYHWARRLLARVREHLERARERLARTKRD